MNDADRRVLTLLVTGGLILAFALVDYGTPQIMVDFPEKQMLTAFAVGACIAQVTLIAAWAVFAPGNLVVRLPWALLLGLTMWYTLAWSDKRAWNYGYAEDVTELGVNLLAGVVALQIPLWIMKWAFRYRMLAPGEPVIPTASERFQFQVKHMLIGTLILAIALSPLRRILPEEGFGRIRTNLSEMFVLVGAAIVASLLATLPCLWGGFVSTHRVTPLALGWLVYCLLVTGVEFQVLCTSLGVPSSRDTGRVFVMAYLINASQGAIVFAVMRCYRALGYRLLRVPRELPPLPECPPEDQKLAWIEPVEVDEPADRGDR
jgi:hypothetical protein